MTTITIQLTGNREAVLDSLVCDFHYWSRRRLTTAGATLTYIMETTDYEQALADCQECCNPEAADRRGVQIAAIG